MKRQISFLLALFFFLIFRYHDAMAARRYFLWDKISSQCVPNYIRDGSYSPCAMVDLKNGYVIYKVDGDKYQYLLLPTEKISGIEDPKLMGTRRNYFYQAWQSRVFLVRKIGKNINDQDILVAINAKNERTQDQLHLHISCISEATRAAFETEALKRATFDWSHEPTEINGRSYYYRKMNLEQARDGYFFKIIKGEVDSLHMNIAWTGVALANLDPQTFIVLLAAGGPGQGGAGEELEDHTCRVASP